MTKNNAQPSKPQQLPIAVASRSFSQHPGLREELKRLFTPVKFNETGKVLVGSALIEFLTGHSHVITGLEVLDDAALAQLPDLKVVAKYGVGLDMLDLHAMERRGVLLGWTPGVNRQSVAELALAMALSLSRGISSAHLDLRKGIWRSPRGNLLSGKTVGIIGCGNIGKTLIGLLQPFQCRLLVHDILDFPEFYAKHSVERSSLKDLLSQSDVVSVHVPLTSRTRGMLGQAELALLKPSAFLINTARGGIVDEQALKEMLKKGLLAGAACDVFAVEPPADLELLELPQFLATPHIGANAVEVAWEMGQAAIQGLLFPKKASEYHVDR